ncbi:HNRNPK [Branchiostoma lanceolatum]|uniref:HNRNPK protein n=1 Tax=Branchiostoma lanceolatum TaxID=7740 RepID=A0A8J9ZLV2_BRALA|nr:HNRNPK [Branchiostoma lanceolatum]
MESEPINSDEFKQERDSWDQEGKRPAEDEGGQSNKRARPPPPVDLRILLQSKNAGAIIGKGGLNIKRLRSEYKATVTVPDCTGPERILTISADLNTACACLLDIIPVLEDYQQHYQQHKDLNFDCELRMLVHQSQAGCIIGRAGFKIKELREQTEANIKVYSECCPGSTERVVALTGKPEKCIGAIKKIIELLQKAPIKGPNSHYDPFMYEEYYAGEYGGYTAFDDQRGGGGRGGDRRGGFSGRGGSGGGPRGRGGPPRGHRGGMGGQRSMGGNMGHRDDFHGGHGGGRAGGPRMMPSEMTQMRSGPPPSRGLGGGGPPPMRNRGGMGGQGGRGGMGASDRMGGYGGGGRDFTRDDYGGGSRFSRDRGDRDGMGGGGFGGGGGGGGFRSGNDGFSGVGNTTSTQVTIPKELAGSIIGRGGSRIRSIRERSEAQIKIDEPLPGSTDRIITISGNEDQIRNAQYLLQTSVRGDTLMGDHGY